MNKPLEAENAPISPGEMTAESQKRHLVDFWQALRDRQDTLLLIRQLNQMVHSVQLHRGMSMSLLAGSEYFEESIARLQRQLCGQLQALEVFADQTGELLSSRDKEMLHLAWRTISHDWRDDPVIDNFELHSHFIEELLVMIAHLSERLRSPLTGPWRDATPPSDPGSVAYPQAFKQIELLNFIGEQMPRMIEQIAKIRGLSSHAATMGRVEYLQDRKLRYLIQGVKAQNEKLRHQAERLSSIIDVNYASLADIKTYEIKLLYLFSRLEDDLLAGTEIQVDGRHLFKLSTEVIEIYSRIVNDGWYLMRRWVDDEAEAWIHNWPASAADSTS